MIKQCNYAEHNILNESEAAFNLSIFYGKDAHWTDVINACRRYPMFAERQVVLLKEAQQMRDIEKLEAILKTRLNSTVFVVSYKEKKLDARKKFAKLIKEKGVLLTTKKMYESQLPEWTQELVQSQKDLAFLQKDWLCWSIISAMTLPGSKMKLNKIIVNLGKRTTITEDDIEEYIGVSKDFNVFELQSALAARDLASSIRIIQYFEANPKAAPIQLVLPSLYSFFSKVFMVFGAASLDEKTIAAAIGVNPYFMKDYLQAAKLYAYPGVEKVLVIAASL